MKINPDISDYESGDVNMDGEITQEDLTLIQSYILGTETLTGKQFKLADMNEDSIVDTADYIILKRQLGL